ncbi:Qat anti-phage system TatD family nuclease QatD [Franzmannia qiaohouensis]|uniref:TatD family hydrolase n=1 Tax=Franzmannia qiaohouensis TaxID=1329370 RepID=A0ABU1HAN6_9GAMM|nr:Qat anti-phage system TatD family nuclease QatD [Halomonas qiaohouensis]MDR5904505.1 TatD family hydrolase [Halomonas qiaohouensis]
MTVDMHCHLDLYSEPFNIAEECRRRGTYVLSVTTTPKAWNGTSKLAEDAPRIQTALGLHPQLAHQRRNEVELFDALISQARYVGEVGLDGGKGFKEHWQVQISVFRHILRSVHRNGGRIMSIHSRASAEVVIDEITGINGTPILHWFTGTPAQLKKAIDIGCWFSVGPAMLLTKSGRQLASMMPKDRVLTETDGPFAKSDGKLLMPWDSDLATRQLASLWQLPIELAEYQIKSNLKKLAITQ